VEAESRTGAAPEGAAPATKNVDSTAGQDAFRRLPPPFISRVIRAQCSTW